ncbi:MAG: hypothetical protein RLZZ338_1117 [Cyanobacteriota bacterium]
MDSPTFPILTDHLVFLRGIFSSTVTNRKFSYTPRDTAVPFPFVTKIYKKNRQNPLTLAIICVYLPASWLNQFLGPPHQCHAHCCGKIEKKDTIAALPSCKNYLKRLEFCREGKEKLRPLEHRRKCHGLCRKPLTTINIRFST